MRTLKKSIFHVLFVTMPYSFSITNNFVLILFSVTIMCIIPAFRFVFLLCGERENRAPASPFKNNIGVLLSYFYQKPKKI